MLHKSFAILVGLALGPMVSQVEFEYDSPAAPLPSGPYAAPPAVPNNAYPGTPGLNPYPSAPNPGLAPGTSGGFPAVPGYGPASGFGNRPGFNSPGFGNAPGFGNPPGFGNAPGFGNTPNVPNTTPGQPMPPTAQPSTPPAPTPPPAQPAEIRIEFRQPAWREQAFTGANASDQASQYASKAREMGYEVHLEDYQDRSRVGFRMTEWTIYATVYRPERAQQVRAWLESQGLETRASDARPPLSTIPPDPNNRFGTPRFGFDPSARNNGLPQAW